MTCYTLYDKDRKPVGHLCGDFGVHCKECGDVGDEFLCDYPVGEGKTCDAHLCNFHAHEVAPNTHYCSGHFEKWNKFVENGGVKTVLENVTPYKR